MTLRLSAREMAAFDRLAEQKAHEQDRAAALSAALIPPGSRAEAELTVMSEQIGTSVLFTWPSDEFEAATLHRPNGQKHLGAIETS